MRLHLAMMSSATMAPFIAETYTVASMIFLSGPT